MKNIVNYLLSASLLFIFAGCKKNQEAAPTVPKKDLLTKYNAGTSGTFTYTYDNTGKMKTAEFTGNTANPASLTTFKTYGEQDRLLEINRSFTNGSLSSDKSLFFYTAEGKLERIDSYVDGTQAIAGYLTYEYNVNIVTEKQFNNRNLLSFYTVYRYDAPHENVLQIDDYNSSGVLQLKTVYSNFDSKKSNAALYPIGYGAGVARNKNNYQTFTRTSYPSGSTTGQTFSYEYNSDGYVTKRTSSTGAVVEYEYTKQ